MPTVRLRCERCLLDNCYHKRCPCECHKEPTKEQFRPAKLHYIPKAECPSCQDEVFRVAHLISGAVTEKTDICDVCGAKLVFRMDLGSGKTVMVKAVEMFDWELEALRKMSEQGKEPRHEFYQDRQPRLLGKCDYTWPDGDYCGRSPEEHTPDKKET